LSYAETKGLQIITESVYVWAAADFTQTCGATAAPTAVVARNRRRVTRAMSCSPLSDDGL